MIDERLLVGLELVDFVLEKSIKKKLLIHYLAGDIY